MFRTRRPEENRNLVRDARRCLTSRVWWVLACLMWAAVLAFAQHSVVEDAGGGKKTETDYDASDRVTRQRTLGPNGEILAKIDYKYLLGYPASRATVVEQTTTTYRANGKISEVTRQRFDENTNFTQELIRIFDESGRQIGGHTLAHNPWNGLYTCADWNVAVKAYRRIECPSGEESSGGAETVKKVTRQEVMQALDLARAAAQRPDTRSVSTLEAAVASESGSGEIGIVLPAHVRSDERISGIATRHASAYDKIRDVRVTRVAVPPEMAGETSSLAGWTFETVGEAAQAADGPITFTVPHNSSELKIVLRQRDDPTHSATALIHFAKASRATPSPRSFETGALCLKDQLCMVRGPFSGESRQTFAALDDRPAKIVGETQEAALIAVPEDVDPASRHLFISEGNKLMAFPIVLGEFTIANNDRKLEAGKTLTVFPTLDGPAEIPDELWQAKTPLAEMRRKAQELNELKIPYDDEKDNRGESRRELASKEKEGDGKILVVVKNDTPQQLSLRGSKNQMLLFHLNDESFRMGAFKFTLVVEALKSGPVHVKGYVIPFLAPVVGQEFEAGPQQPNP